MEEEDFVTPGPGSEKAREGDAFSLPGPGVTKCLHRLTQKGVLIVLIYSPRSSGV